jgi:hypothetical protein
VQIFLYFTVGLDRLYKIRKKYRCVPYSNKYFFFRSVINTVKIWFFHISLLYCTRKNILIFALVQYEWHSEHTGILKIVQIFLYFTVGLDRLYKIRKKYRCVPNVIHIAHFCAIKNHIALSCHVISFIDFARECNMII